MLHISTNFFFIDLIMYEEGKIIEIGIIIILLSIIASLSWRVESSIVKRNIFFKQIRYSIPLTIFFFNIIFILNDIFKIIY
ncbi:MAG: hypothetical protein AAB913_02715 [Patescibacteria group bacterium]